ncbi:hypothetical protein GGR57DRAFT_510984 [Xylariaceae sp. FL1272]|nr:hypothetical protein GGR57DRAFT_510984 [Xylariaceae sp. FL1272]
MLFRTFLTLAASAALVSARTIPNYPRDADTSDIISVEADDVSDFDVSVFDRSVEDDTDDLDDDMDTDDDEEDDGVDLPNPDLDEIFSTNTTTDDFPTGGLVREPVTPENNPDTPDLKKRFTCPAKAMKVKGSKVKGKGLKITNGDSVARSFYIYHNSCDSIPFKYISIPAHKTRYVGVPAHFEGRITRGNNKLNLAGVPRTLGTWLEFSIDATGVMWGDVSLIRGCDGPAAVWSLDNAPRRHKGFRQNILPGAPKKALTKKASGAKVIRPTEAADGSINVIPRNYDLKKVGAGNAYVDDNHGNPVINSASGRMGVWFGKGRI